MGSLGHCCCHGTAGHPWSPQNDRQLLNPLRRRARHIDERRKHTSGVCHATEKPFEWNAPLSESSAIGRSLRTKAKTRLSTSTRPRTSGGSTHRHGSRRRSRGRHRGGDTERVDPLQLLVRRLVRLGALDSPHRHHADDASPQPPRTRHAGLRVGSRPGIDRGHRRDGSVPPAYRRYTVAKVSNGAGSPAPRPAGSRSLPCLDSSRTPSAASHTRPRSVE